ncbi:LacI family DNA-binding transcriptional regulator [Halobacillus sp. Nhm2S1]|uniref:LacI family DNA-binding transcriptional regulator n=1 Tax=Halobacillus sp. Nhm2S1 TaxID=2866716 RepID=UPI001C73359A|nr:LacI family DNA-binding transcriptional regulator [Halobacillus sp. Nhm2S1]MBX0359512.1 LacI family transcriptional regulator [Halobacillus sp. Nhm2S1]
MATISDVAERTGLSKATVSRVINNHPYISKEKRELVYKAMEELGYQPNPSARRLRGQLTNTIGVIVPRIVNPFFSYLVDALEQVAYENNYQVLMFQSDEKKDKELYFLNLLKTKQVDGLIMTAIENEREVIESYTRFGPILFCNEYLSQSEIPVVRVDQSKAAYIGTKHLLDRGYRKIAYCTGGLFVDDGKDKDRNIGFQKALNDHQININTAWVFINKHTIEDGRHVMRQIAGMNEKPDAIFTGSDEIAAGVILEAKSLGMKIPEDLAVMGFDDQPIAEMIDPALTTIQQPIKEMGTISVDMLLRLLKNQPLDQKHKELSVELVIRSST